MKMAIAAALVLAAFFGSSANAADPTQDPMVWVKLKVEATAAVKRLGDAIEKVGPEYRDKRCSVVDKVCIAKYNDIIERCKEERRMALEMLGALSLAPAERNRMIKKTWDPYSKSNAETTRRFNELNRIYREL